MNKSRIEWCDHTLNVITGCRQDCPYCYARSITTRFSGDLRENLRRQDEYMLEGDGLYVLEKPFTNKDGSLCVYPFGFAPTFHKYQLQKLEEIKEGRIIFVGAMADMFGEWIPHEWIQMVTDACKASPQHYYLFLTKNPERYGKEVLPGGYHHWYGTTITKQSELARINALPENRKRFVSFEPLLEPVVLGDKDLIGVNWIIIGAETGRRKGRIVPEAGWIQNIVKRADELKIPVFMKDSLVPVVGESTMRREFPAVLQKVRDSERLPGTKIGKCLRCKRDKEKGSMITIEARAPGGSCRRTLFYVCTRCYGRWCEEMGIGNHKEILCRKGGKENAKEKKLPSDGR